MSTVALLTDFGTRDPYVAAMKGVILSRTEASIVDLSHELRPFAILEAAWFLDGVVPYLPQRSWSRCVVLGVIDPGVGSDRAIVVAEDDGRFFVGPDNGLFDMALSERATVARVRESPLFLPRSSTTFHGRDRFAPLAAALANGTAPEDLGEVVERSALVSLEYERPVYGTEQCDGTVMTVDRFGNVVTDLRADQLGDPESWMIEHAGWMIDRWADHYDAIADEVPHLLVGSRGTVEISLRQHRAADAIGIEPGTSVRMSRSPAAAR